LAWRWDEDKKGKEQVVLGGVVAMVRRGHAMCVISLSRGKTTRETTNEGVRAESGGLTWAIGLGCSARLEERRERWAPSKDGPEEKE
jgi:hypothetical protein